MTRRGRERALAVSDGVGDVEILNFFCFSAFGFSIFRDARASSNSFVLLPPRCSRMNGKMKNKIERNLFN
jgi:hypothetical protein